MRALGLTLTSLLLASAAHAGDAKGPEVGDVMPHFVLRTLNPKLSGQANLSSRKLVGKRADAPAKALVLTFGASYCEPCKKELAELKGHTEVFKRAGAVLAAVVIDKDPEGVEKMRALTVDELALPFPVLKDGFGLVARRYNADKLPKMVLIDSAGVVRWFQSGYSEETIKTLFAQLAMVTGVAPVSPTKPR